MPLLLSLSWRPTIAWSLMLAVLALVALGQLSRVHRFIYFQFYMNGEGTDTQIATPTADRGKTGYPAFRTYSIAFLLALLGLFAAISAFNIAVDPFFYFRTPLIEGFNAIKMAKPAPDEGAAT